MALAPYPAPIGPVNDTPHGVILHLLDDLIAVRAQPSRPGSLVEPIFLGIAARIRDRGASDFSNITRAEYDLDDDGPVREEYRLAVLARLDRGEQSRRRRENLEKTLPPPSVWSPSEDPPIVRSRPKYVAVQRPAEHYSSHSAHNIPSGYPPVQRLLPPASLDSFVDAQGAYSAYPANSLIVPSQYFVAYPPLPYSIGHGVSSLHPA